MGLRGAIALSRMRSMFESTKWFFAMFTLHMCSGRPVEADSAEAIYCTPSQVLDNQWSG